jgi:Tfp pilus assembly protein PilN
MKEIDFLPEPYREACHRRDRRVTRIWFAVIGVCALGLWFLAGEMRIRKAQANVDYLARQNTTVQAGLDLIKKLKTEQVDLRQKFKVIQDLGPRVNSVELLATISKFMPAQIGLKEYQLTCTEIDEKKEGEEPNGIGALAATVLEKSVADKKAKPKKILEIKVGVVGLARSEMDVAVLVGQLSSYKKFQDIRLEYCKAEVIQGRKATQFKITFAVKPNSPAEIRRVEG